MTELNLPQGFMRDWKWRSRGLAAPEDQRKTVANFVVTVGKIVNDLHEQAAKDEKAGSK